MGTIGSAVHESLLDSKLSSTQDIRDLSNLLHFNPREGRIWLGDQRAVLMGAETFTALRRLLVQTLGSDRAADALIDIGQQMGFRDASLIRRLRPNDHPVSQTNAGARLHALKGIISSERVRAEFDRDGRLIESEVILRHSFEAEAHINAFGISAETACWMEVGYVSGFVSEVWGRPYTAREVECQAMGHSHCKVLVKPSEDWAPPPAPHHAHHPHCPPAIYTGHRSREVAAPDHQPASANLVTGVSASFAAAMQNVRRVASTNATVLLLGESGVGKSVLAREIHKRSWRNESPFVEVNCAAMPEQLIESELFGVERGAYSGAEQSRAGRFEVAAGGTIFLDEIGSLGFAAQAKLLRVLQNGELERLGSTRTIKPDVRVIAATNDDLLTLVEQKLFRSDLYYRLNVFPITVPPLRDRKEDIPALLDFYLERFAHEHRRRVPSVTARAMRVMLSYSWPGNIREFANIIERAIIIADGDPILDLHHLFNHGATPEFAHLMRLDQAGFLVSLRDVSDEPAVESALPPQDAGIGQWASEMVRRRGVALFAVEDALVRAALQEAGGNISKAAGLLGISRAQMDYRAKKLGDDSAASA